jgi:hypothetical protein
LIEEARLDLHDFPETAIGYHSRTRPTGDVRQSDGCVYLDGSSGLGEGSRVAGRDVMRLALTEGEEAVWRELEEVYRQAFVLDAVSTVSRLSRGMEGTSGTDRRVTFVEAGRAMSGRAVITVGKP